MGHHTRDHTLDIGGRIRWTAIAVAAAATFGVGSLAAAGSGSTGFFPSPAARPAAAPPIDPYSVCLRTGSMAPDRVEARVERCRLLVDELYADSNFVACLRNAATTPDASERWLESCRIATSH